MLDVAFKKEAKHLKTQSHEIPSFEAISAFLLTSLAGRNAEIAGV